MKKIRRLIRLLKIIAPEYIIGVAGIIFLILLFVLSKFLYSPSVIKEMPVSEVPLAYSKLSLSAKAVYVYDAINNSELFSKNADAQLPLASLSKVMMAVTALSILPETAVVTIDPRFLETEGDSGLFSSERWKLKDLLDLTLLESSNDGANAIASVAGAVSRGGVPDDLGREQFIRAMNKKTEELGLAQTYFLNSTGLDENLSVSGGYGSARDMANLFYYAISKYPRLFDATRYESREFDSLSLLKHKSKNTNKFVSKIPSLLGSKTGFTDLAGGNLTIAFDAGINRPIVISVLGSTEEGRFEDTEKLVWATLDYLNEVN